MGWTELDIRVQKDAAKLTIRDAHCANRTLVPMQEEPQPGVREPLRIRMPVVAELLVDFPILDEAGGVVVERFLGLGLLSRNLAAVWGRDLGKGRAREYRQSGGADGENTEGVNFEGFIKMSFEQSGFRSRVMSVISPAIRCTLGDVRGHARGVQEDDCEVTASRRPGEADRLLDWVVFQIEERVPDDGVGGTWFMGVTLGSIDYRWLGVISMDSLMAVLKVNRSLARSSPGLPARTSRTVRPGQGLTKVQSLPFSLVILTPPTTPPVNSAEARKAFLAHTARSAPEAPLSILAASPFRPFTLFSFTFKAQASRCSQMQLRSQPVLHDGLDQRVAFSVCFDLDLRRRQADGVDGFLQFPQARHGQVNRGGLGISEWVFGRDVDVHVGIGNGQVQPFSVILHLCHSKARDIGAENGAGVVRLACAVKDIARDILRSVGDHLDVLLILQNPDCAAREAISCANGRRFSLRRGG